MAATDTDNNNNDSGEEPGGSMSVAQHLWLGGLEMLINAFVDLDPEIKFKLGELEGLVIRVKARDPYQAFYLEFTSEGIEVNTRCPGLVKVRLNGSMMDILAALLGTGGHRLRFWGDPESIRALETLLNDFNLRTSAQRWLREHIHLDQLLGRIRSNDPSWISDLLPLPRQMQQTQQDLARLNNELQQQQEQLALLRQENRRQRRHDLIAMTLALALVVLGLHGTHDLAQLASAGGERLVLLALGLGVVAFRLWKTRS